MQLGATALTVAVLAAVGGGRYPLYVDLMTYAAAAAGAVYVVTRFLDWQAARRNRPAPGRTEG